MWIRSVIALPSHIPFSAAFKNNLAASVWNGKKFDFGPSWWKDTLPAYLNYFIASFHQIRNLLEVQGDNNLSFSQLPGECFKVDNWQFVYQTRFNNVWKIYFQYLLMMNYHQFTDYQFGYHTCHFYVLAYQNKEWLLYISKKTNS